MNDKMLRMLGKKKEKMGDAEKEAKMSVIKEMRNMASGIMGDNLKNLKKVTIASDSKEGLEEGLDKAKEVIEKQPMQEESDESSEEEQMEDCNMSEDEIDEKIKELMDMKAKLKA
jgi:hypothetical protein